VGLIVLLATAAGEGRADRLVAFGIFGFSLIALYAASALYHRRGEPAAGGPHVDLRAHSGHLHPFLPSRSGRRLAGWVALPYLEPCAVRHPAQAPLDGRPALAVGSAIPRNGMGSRDRGSRPLSGGANTRTPYPGCSGFTSCGTSSSWRGAFAISGRCWGTSRRLRKTR
jgi:hypothetical protein